VRGFGCNHPGCVREVNIDPQSSPPGLYSQWFVLVLHSNIEHDGINSADTKILKTIVSIVAPNT
jgi:hypothetical protein